MPARTLQAETDWLINVLRQRMDGHSEISTLAEALLNAGWAMLTDEQQAHRAAALLLAFAEHLPAPADATAH